MKVVFLAAEAIPFAKIGGLGEVVGGLSSFLVRDNIDVDVIIPRYKFIEIDEKYIKEKETFLSTYKNNIFTNTAIKLQKDRCRYIFIELDERIDYFNRPNIYGYDDDQSRFLYFSKAAMDFLKAKKEKIDILHIHDWHTSIAAILKKDLYKDQDLYIDKIVLNIHNLKYQGITPYKLLYNIGLNGKKYFSKKTLKKNKCFSKDINLLKGGLLYSDSIVAVSPTYSNEIMTKKYGCGLEKTLKENNTKVCGILNGIDTKIWHPSIDKDIPYKFNKTDDIQKVIEKKNLNKEYLQKKLGLLECKKPLIANIGRLVYQKSPELIIKSILKTKKLNGQFVLLGSSQIKKIAKMFNKIEKKFENSLDISINQTFDEALSHLIFAAADFVIIPSEFEPCGLTQMIAMQYGTIPIVRKTGGLADTVFDVDDDTVEGKIKNGFVFNNTHEREMNACLKRAIDIYYNNPLKKNFLIKNCLNIDHSLEKVAKRYEILYQKLLNL